MHFSLVRTYTAPPEFSSTIITVDLQQEKIFETVTSRSITLLFYINSATAMPSAPSNPLAAKGLPAAFGFAVSGVGVPAVVPLVGETTGTFSVGALVLSEYGIVIALLGSRRVALKDTPVPWLTIGAVPVPTGL